MLNKDAKVKFLEHQLEEREKEIVSMRDSEKTFASPEDERVYRLELRLKEMEALVKGLTEEVLDLKTVTMRLNRAFEAKVEAERAERLKPKVFVEEVPEKKEAVVQNTVPTPQKVVSPAPAPEEEGDMDLIMQTDGTLKRERRKRSDYIVAPTNQAPAGLTSERRSGSRRNTERRSSAIIFAEEEDDTSIRK